jgi:hypothetical protein
MTKTRKTKVLAVVVVLALLVAAGGWCLLSAPFAWYDKQGHELAMFLDGDSDIPPSKTDANRREVYTTGRAYLTLTGWKTGSELLVYGVVEPAVQERIIARARDYVRDRHMNRVIIRFYPERVFVPTGGNAFDLVKEKPLRSTWLASD